MMNGRRRPSYVTPDPNSLRCYSGDQLQPMPCIYGGAEDHFKPGDGSTNEEYSRFNHNCANPYTGESMRQFYSDFHTLSRSMYNNRYRPGSA